MHAVAVINSALALLGQSGISVAIQAATTSTDVTAPNGGTAANLYGGDPTDFVVTTTEIQQINPYVVGTFDIGEIKPIAYVDVVNLTLSAGTSRGEFCLQSSTDGIVWKQVSDFFTVPSSGSNSRRINVAAEARHFRVARIGDTDLDTATASLASIDIYPFGTNDKDVTVAQLYGAKRDAILAAHPWTCTRRKMQLTASDDADDPITEWTQAYELPDWRLGNVRAVFLSADDDIPFKEWELFGNRLYCNESAVYIDYQVRAEEDTWPEWLVTLMQYALASEFAEPITDQTSKAEFYAMKAYGTPAAEGKGGQFRQARNLESQGKPSERIQDFSLVSFRF